jgi:hypothetical protein
VLSLSGAHRPLSPCSLLLRCMYCVYVHMYARVYAYGVRVMRVYVCVCVCVCARMGESVRPYYERVRSQPPLCFWLFIKVDSSSFYCFSSSFPAHQASYKRLHGPWRTVQVRFACVVGAYFVGLQVESFCLGHTLSLLNVCKC